MKKEIIEPSYVERETITEEMYDDILDEQGDIHIGSLSYSPSYVLKNVDPTAYQCGLNDIQEYETVWSCPICDEEKDDEDEARYCCQEEEEEEDYDENEV